jgi:hypothetical protein
MKSAFPCLVLAAALSWPAGANEGVPQFQVDPFWPKPLPNNWLLGQVSGIATSTTASGWCIDRHP